MIAFVLLVLVLFIQSKPESPVSAAASIKLASTMEDSGKYVKYFFKLYILCIPNIFVSRDTYI